MHHIEELAEEFLRYTMDNLLPFNRQETAGTGEGFWCSDWWTLEVAKYFYLGGKKGYLDDIPARRLHGIAPYRDRMVRYGTWKEDQIKILEEYKEEANGILVCEIGRGLDLMCALSVKEWEVYYCYDNNQGYKKLLEGFFDRYGCVIKFVHNNSRDIKFDNILQDYDGKVIVLANATKLGSEGAQRLLDCSKVARIANNGRLINSKEEW